MGHRRPAVLRREDVALLADVGITWYTWLEQGRSIKIASETLDRIGRALRLDVSECEYLLKLVHARSGPACAWHEALPSNVRSLVERYSNGCACALGARRDVLAWNAAFAHFFGLRSTSDVGSLERNGLWILFAEQRARQLFPDWERAARTLLATFRFAYADFLGDVAFQTLIEALAQQSTDFVRMWSDIDILSPLRWTIPEMRDPETNQIVAVETVLLPVPDSRSQILFCSFPSR